MHHGHLTVERLADMRGQPVHDATGSKIGEIEGIYYDDETHVPEWIAVASGGIRSKRRLVPVESAEEHDGGVQVPFGKDQVEQSPTIDDDSITVERERELASHYGMTYSEERSSTGLPGGRIGGEGSSPDRSGMGRSDERSGRERATMPDTSRPGSPEGVGRIGGTGRAGMPRDTSLDERASRAGRSGPEERPDGRETAGEPIGEIRRMRLRT